MGKTWNIEHGNHVAHTNYRLPSFNFNFGELKVANLVMHHVEHSAKDAAWLLFELVDRCRNFVRTMYSMRVPLDEIRS